MKTLFGQDAKQDFQKRIPVLKDDHLYWCVIVVRWYAATPAPWDDTDTAMLLTSQLEKSLAADKSKAILLFLPTGDILVMGDHLPNPAYRRVHAALEAFLKDLALPAANVQCADFDLSATWDGFMAQCKEIYTALTQQANKLTVAEKPRLMEYMNAELTACRNVISNRSSSPRKLNLLFVEDEPSIRQLLNGLLAPTGHTLSFAASGKEAVEEYCRLPPHMVFLDINLPDISGLELLELFKTHDAGIHAVMLTSHAAAQEVQTAKQHGAKGYIVKPFSQQKLTDCLQQYRSI